MTDPSLRDRLIEACEPWDLPDGASIESSVVRNAHEIADAVLAVIVDALRNPDEAMVDVVSEALGWHRYAVQGVLNVVAAQLAGGSDD